MILRKFLTQGICSCYLFRTQRLSSANLYHSYVKRQPVNLKTNTANFSEQAYSVNTNVAKDVILYKYENPKFFKMLNLFALCQFGFWAYMSHFAFTTLKDVPVNKTKENVWWRQINLGEKKYRTGITIISFMFGYGILAAAWMFSLKSVRYLILRKGGDAITFVTYGPFNKNRMMTVNLKYISCRDTRGSARTYLPIKVKNQFLHYILDMKGEFKNTKLFDYTAGLKRTWKD